MFSQNTLTTGAGSYYAGNVISLTLADSATYGYNSTNLLLCIETINQLGINIVSASAFIYPNNIGSSYTGYWQVLTDRGVYSNMTYQAGDIVTYTDGKAYVAINDNTATNPSTSDWILLNGYPPAPSGVACFLKDAPVLTPDGYRRIDSLKVGDLVQTAKGPVAIQMVKTQLVTPSSAVNPYVIPKGHLGAISDLAISPNHKVQVGHNMIEARYLSLKQKEMRGAFMYYNLELPDYENMTVAGVTVESLFPLAHISVTTKQFREIVLAQYGAFTAEILMSLKNHIKILEDGRVNIPVNKRMLRRKT